MTEEKKDQGIGGLIATIVGILIFGIFGVSSDGVDIEKLENDSKISISNAKKQIFNIDDKDVVVECNCGGKGYIVHGDGHQTPCPCLVDGDCKCKSEKDTGDSWE